MSTKWISDRDKERVQDLYFQKRLIVASIARLFGVSHVTIINIVLEMGPDISMIPDTECLLCGLEDVQTCYIDGNTKNKNPQNVIGLCEACKRRMLHRQLKRHNGVIKPQFESSSPE